MKSSSKRDPLLPKKEGIFIRAAISSSLALLFLFVLFAEAALSSPLISQIEIQGNKHIKSREIENAIHGKIGEPLSEQMIRDDMQAIYDMGYFYSVQVLKEEGEAGLTLIFRIVENPRITQIELEGPEKEEEDRVKKLLTLRQGQILDFKRVKKTRSRILHYYQRKGFFSSKVQISQISSKEGECNILIAIEKGERVKIAEVMISGNSHLSTEKILPILKVKRGQYFDEKKLSEGTKRVIDRYQRRGYYFATFKEPRFEFFERRGKRVKIILEIQEGKRIFVSKVNVKGNEYLSSSEILATLRPRKGEIFIPEFLEEGIRRVEAKYGKAGYLYLDMDRDLEFYREEGQVAISLLIREGPQVRVGKVSIEGNERSKERVFTHSLLIKEGEVFDVEKARESWRRIYNLGFFEKVSIHPFPTSSRKIMDLLVEVEEGERTGSFLIGAGYSQNSGWEGKVQIHKDNLWGEGKKISLEWEFAKNRNDYDMSFLDRWWKDKDLSLRLSVYDKELKYSGTENYKKGKTGGKVEWGWPFQKYARCFIGLRSEQIEISRVDEEPLPEDIEEGKKMRRSLELTFERDTRVRDEAFNAYKGSYSYLFMETNGGTLLKGDLNFTKYKAELREYLRRGDFWMSPILALRLRGKLGERLPSYEKFRVGGQQTLRGYGLYEFSGDKVLLGTVELRFPLSKNMSGVIFVDGAEIWDEDPESPEVRTGWGFGARIMTPIGPLQLDWGVGETGEGEFYFGIGQAF